jgi:hypothetical protein
MPAPRLVTLMELLQAFVSEYVVKALRLTTSILKLEDAHIFNDQRHREMLRSQLSELSEMCETGELTMTKITVDHVVKCLKSFDDPECPPEAKELLTESFTGELLTEYLLKINDRLSDELGTKTFFQLPHAKKKYFETPTKGWEKVVERFADTQSDIEEMGRCFALSRYPASIFHSLLVVESGLIMLGKEIGAADHKPGWDATCNKMKQLIDGGHNKYPALRITFSTLEQINHLAQTMKHAWRNKVSHVAGKLFVLRSDFTPDIAEEIITATRSFMRTLATDLPK